MERKKTILLGIFLFGCGLSSLHAQETTLSGGGDATGIGSLSYSIGQVFYVTNSGIDGTVAQGVQQAYEISSIVGIDEFDAISLGLEVYPNPTANYLTLDVKDFSFGALDYVLYDLSGRVLANEELSQKKTIIEMRDFPPSTYFLKVSDGTSIMKTFKIIKN
ncbi:MAG: T9SS type A sorting domain-containing protein [Crocinitomicaceae bacterium]|nr:T9SS type A sorting domain-containing protein [Crocinitomicaceae bacterium]